MEIESYKKYLGELLKKKNVN